MRASPRFSLLQVWFFANFDLCYQGFNTCLYVHGPASVVPGNSLASYFFPTKQRVLASQNAFLYQTECFIYKNWLKLFFPLPYQKLVLCCSLWQVLLMLMHAWKLTVLKLICPPKKLRSLRKIVCVLSCDIPGRRHDWSDNIHTHLLW